MLLPCVVEFSCSHVSSRDDPAATAVRVEFYNLRDSDGVSTARKAKTFSFMQMRNRKYAKYSSGGE